MKRHNETHETNGSPQLTEKEDFNVDWIQKI